jgi:hypothetical protein
MFAMSTTVLWADENDTLNPDEVAVKPPETELPPDYVMEWEPEAIDYDWIQLTSGEWLKGEFKSMYNNSVEFDSDKLDLLNIDWEDVKFLKTHRNSQINIEGNEPISGKLKIEGKKITVTQDGGIKIFNREELIALTPTGEREIDLWSIKFNLNFSGKTGNTRQVDFGSKLNAKRRTARSRFVIDYIGNITKTQDTNGYFIETVNNHRLNISDNIYATRNFFYTPISLEYYRDPFQNIDYRDTLGIGIGYTLIDNGWLEWDVNGGPAYLVIKYISVPDNEDRKIESEAAHLGTNMEAELTSTLDLTFKYDMQAARESAGGYTHHMITSFESEITGSLDFDVSLVWDRIGSPTADENGVIPKKDDYRLMLGITYTL